MSVQLDRRAEELRLRVVRRAMRHDSAPKHVAGSASFIDDIREPEGLLHIAVGGAPVAAGQLLGVDFEKARAAPGVVAILTAADIPGKNDVSPVFGDDPMFATDSVEFHGQVVFAVVASIGFGLILGAWNGFLVAVLGIQPIIATLILMTGGRGIAMLITEGQILTVNSAPYKMIGGGYWFALPASILIAGLMFAIAAILTRKTALGVMIESVGINPTSSRLAGVTSRTIIWSTYVFSALCAAIAGLMISSNVTAADANSAGLWIEMDAILAVVLGGTSLAGGRYSLTGTLIGAFLIQTLTTTVYSMGIAPEITLVFKAVVVMAVVLLQSPAGRAMLARRRRVRSESTAPAGSPS